MKIITKKSIALLIVAVLVAASLSGCAKKQTVDPAEFKMKGNEEGQVEMKKTGEIAPDGQEIYDATGDEEVVDVTDGDILMGGWNIGIAEGAALPEEVQTAFDKALEGYVGMSLEPIAYLGSQVVAGANYAILCKGTPVVPGATPALKVVIIYAALDGSASISSVSDFSVADYNTGDMNTKAETGVPGGWFASTEPACELGEEPAEALNKALEGFVGSNVEPLAVVGSQVVAGMNFAYICRLTTVTPDAMPSLGVVIVYRDLSGNASISGINTLNIGDFNK